MDAVSRVLLSPADATEQAVPCSGKVLEGFPTSSVLCLYVGCFAVMLGVDALISVPLGTTVTCG